MNRNIPSDHHSALQERDLARAPPAWATGRSRSSATVIGCAAGMPGMAGMTVWLWQAGMPGWVAPIFVLAALVIFTGLTRAVAEGGVPTISPAMVPAGFVVSTVGGPALGPPGCWPWVRPWSGAASCWSS